MSDAFNKMKQGSENLLKVSECIQKWIKESFDPAASLEERSLIHELQQFPTYLMVESGKSGLHELTQTVLSEIEKHNHHLKAIARPQIPEDKIQDLKTRLNTI